MENFEKQNSSQVNVREESNPLAANRLEEELSGKILEEHSKQVQDDLHELLMRLRKLSGGETTLQDIQKALDEEVKRLEVLGKNIGHLYDEYKKAKEEARVDHLTKLPNRRAFEEMLETKIERAKNDSAELYVLYIDIDDFKKVNDTFGHDVGDEYLRLISKHVMDELRPDDMVARLGGDEFVATIFLRNPHETSDEPFDHREEANAIANRIYHAVRLAKSELWNRFSAQSKKKISESNFLSTIASIGGVRFDGKQDVGSLMKEADKTMFEIKNSGKSRVGWHDEEDGTNDTH